MKSRAIQSITMVIIRLAPKTPKPFLICQDTITPQTWEMDNPRAIEKKINNCPH